MVPDVASDRKVVRVRILTYKSEDAQERDDLVVREGRIAIVLGSDNAPRHQFPCSPEKWLELAVGHAICEGWVQPRSSLWVTFHSRSEDNCDIRVSPTPMQGCEEVRLALHVSEKSRPLPDPATVYAAMKALEREARIFQATGGVHAAAALYESGELGPVIEDISRHAAIDKVIGQAALHPGQGAVLAVLTTSRTSSSIVEKTARAGIPALLSRGAPNEKAIRLARIHNITLVGFLRGNRMNVYHRAASGE